MFHAENCVLVSFQSCHCVRQRCINEVFFIQGPFDKMPGQMGKIQGLEQFLQFQKLFKGQMLFQRLFKARSNHVTIIFHNTAPPFRPPPHPLKKKTRYPVYFEGFLST